VALNGLECICSLVSGSSPPKRGCLNASWLSFLACFLCNCHLFLTHFVGTFDKHNCTAFDVTTQALLAEGRFYSDMELTEQEIERMVMEASRAEFLAGENRRIHIPWHEETSTSAGAEPSSSNTSLCLFCCTWL
jgi:hypothetical protein